MQPISRDGEVEGRTDPRTNLFLAASLISGERSIAVKIRDLSTSGGQVEGLEFPEVGSAMTLVRGSLSVRGHVAWSAERRCGLHFSTRISVSGWIASPANGEQQRVDHLVALVKAGAGPPAMPSHAPSAAEELAGDLTRVSKLLEMLGDELASDPAIVTGHGVLLQNLDIALQTLTVLAETVGGGDDSDAVNLVRLNDLRISCDQALGTC